MGVLVSVGVAVGVLVAVEVCVGVLVGLDVGVDVQLEVGLGVKVAPAGPTPGRTLAVAVAPGDTVAVSVLPVASSVGNTLVNVGRCTSAAVGVAVPSKGGDRGVGVDVKVGTMPMGNDGVTVAVRIGPAGGCAGGDASPGGTVSLASPDLGGI